MTLNPHLTIVSVRSSLFLHLSPFTLPPFCLQLFHPSTSTLPPLNLFTFQHSTLYPTTLLYLLPTTFTLYLILSLFYSSHLLSFTLSPFKPSPFTPTSFRPNNPFALFPSILSHLYPYYPSPNLPFYISFLPLHPSRLLPFTT